MTLSYRESTLLVPTTTGTTSGASYDVTAYPVGAVIVSVTSKTYTVDAGHSFRAGDKVLRDPGTTNEFSGTDTVQSVTATTVVMGQNVSGSGGQRLVNLGVDTGTSSPNYDASPVVIYSDADGSTAVSNSRVTANGTTGEFSYYHKGDGRFWELIRNGSAAVVDVVAGHAAVAGRYNVVDYGAAGDGTTVDTARIQAAIDSADTNAEVFLPPGTFLVADDVGILLDSDMTLTGPGVVKRSTVDSSVPLVLINAKTDCHVVGVKIDGNSVADSDSPSLEVRGASERVTIRGCYLYDSHSLWISQCDDVRISNCDISGMTFGINLGHDTFGSGGAVREIHITDCHIHDCTSDGIKVHQDVERCIVNGNSLYDNGSDGLDGYVAADELIISDNSIYSNTNNGVDLKESTDQLQTDTSHWSRKTMVSNNMIHDNGAKGVQITNEADTDWPFFMQVIGNQCFGNARQGIRCDGFYSVIANNIVYANCTETTQNDPGILVTGSGTEDVEGVMVQGNVCVNNGNATDASNSGIQIANATRCMIQGNFCDSTSNADVDGLDQQELGIIIDSTCTDIMVMHNILGSGLTTKLSDSGDNSIPFQNIGAAEDFTIGLREFTKMKRTAHVIDAAGTQDIERIIARNGSGTQEWRLTTQKTATTLIWVLRDSADSVVSSALALSTSGLLTIDDLKVNNKIQLPEISDPSAPSSNNSLLYCKDNGAGKTQLVVRFPTGAVQVIATEP